LYWLPRSTEGFMGTSTNEHPASGQGVNLFVQWLCGPPFELVDKPKPRVNCWESVFYTAYCAGLISKGVIRGIYEEAVSIARNRFGEKNMLGLMRGQEVSQEDSRAALGEYITALYQRLGGPLAVGIKAWLDAPPKKGDVIFINDMEHVCLS